MLVIIIDLKVQIKVIIILIIMILPYRFYLIMSLNKSQELIIRWVKLNSCLKCSKLMLPLN